jgi:hypothetical protein
MSNEEREGDVVILRPTQWQWAPVDTDLPVPPRRRAYKRARLHRLWTEERFARFVAWLDEGAERSDSQ